VLARLRARARAGPGRVLVRDSDALPLAGAWLRELEALAGLSTLPLPTLRGPAARLAWRVTARPFRSDLAADADGAPWCVTLLPEADTPARRRALVPLELRLEPPAGWRLEWLHPPPAAGGRLAAGDAAVLRLRPGVR
jgi:hypothetical protein